MRFMVYFKGENDKRFMPMDIRTGELFIHLAYAPIYAENMLEAVKNWIDANKKCAPNCKIQIRLAGTNKVIYQ